MTDAGWIGCGCLSSRNATSLTLSWDPALVGCLEDSQQWVLGAMARHGPRLVPMLWRILGNEQDVCDAYQDTFVKLAYYQSGQKPDHIGAYVFRTASNIAISILRRKAADERMRARLTAGSEPRLTGSAGDDFDARQLQKRLRQCITELPEHLQKVVVLRDLGELGYAQVGAIVGITAGTARVYRCRAIQLLAALMKDE